MLAKNMTHEHDSLDVESFGEHEYSGRIVRVDTHVIELA